MARYHRGTAYASERAGGGGGGWWFFLIVPVGVLATVIPTQCRDTRRALGIVDPPTQQEERVRIEELESRLQAMRLQAAQIRDDFRRRMVEEMISQGGMTLRLRLRRGEALSDLQPELEYLQEQVLHAWLQTIPSR